MQKFLLLLCFLIINIVYIQLVDPLYPLILILLITIIAHKVNSSKDFYSFCIFSIVWTILFMIPVNQDLKVSFIIFPIIYFTSYIIGLILKKYCNVTNPYSFEMGNIKQNKIIIITIIILSSLALITWGHFSKDLGSGVGLFKGISDYSNLSIALVILPLFSIINSFGEEMIFRGVLQDKLSKVFKNKFTGNVLQAGSFSLIHYVGGFPNGLTGVVMTFTYGMILGHLKNRTNGIFSPLITHFFADLTISYFMFFTFLKII